MMPWFDLIFIDGKPDRIAVAQAAWDLLMPTGKMVFHDTHQHDFGAAVFHFAATKNLEVASVVCESALTIITKRVPRVIYDTDTFERRAAWESGHAEPPPEWPARKRSR